MEYSVAFVAGFFTGEGSIMLIANKRVNRSHQPFLAPHFHITNTEVGILEVCRSMIGRKISLANRNKLSYRKPAYRLMIFGYRPILQAIRLLRPYLLGRKAEIADLVARFCQSRLNRASYHSPYTREEREIFERVRLLNRKAGKSYNSRTVTHHA